MLVTALFFILYVSSRHFFSRVEDFSRSWCYFSWVKTFPCLAKGSLSRHHYYDSVFLFNILFFWVDNYLSLGSITFFVLSRSTIFSLTGDLKKSILRIWFWDFILQSFRSPKKGLYPLHCRTFFFVLCVRQGVRFEIFKNCTSRKVFCISLLWELHVEDRDKTSSFAVFQRVPVRIRRS